MLEIGTGSGFVICSVARILEALGHTAVQVLGIDINPEACLATIETLRNHKVRGLESPVVLMICVVVSVRDRCHSRTHQRSIRRLNISIRSSPFIGCVHDAKLKNQVEILHMDLTAALRRRLFGQIDLLVSLTIQTFHIFHQTTLTFASYRFNPLKMPLWREPIRS